MPYWIQFGSNPLPLPVTGAGQLLCTQIHFTVPEESFQLIPSAPRSLQRSADLIVRLDHPIWFAFYDILVRISRKCSSVPDAAVPRAIRNSALTRRFHYSRGVGEQRIYKRSLQFVQYCRVESQPSRSTHSKMETGSER